MSKNALYFLTGSCGSGKTTLLKGVVASYFPHLTHYHFDDLGVPSLQEMNERFGGPEAWQAHNAQQWMRRVATSEAKLTVLDGQIRPTVLRQAAAEVDVAAVHITLIDCNHDERRRRLLEDRSQPELDQLDTYAWAAYLKGQADALNLEVIDTTNVPLEKSIRELAASIELFASQI
ncbi:MAG: hypothetical protein QNJ45_17270 [Ardenticatenaceae bacterium]|nr:hypothetical protein [Ardenticatenaceae bacterium]